MRQYCLLIFSACCPLQWPVAVLCICRFCAITQQIKTCSKLYKALSLMVSDKNFFHDFPYIGLCKTCDPGAGPSLAPGYNLNKIGRGPLNDATHQISKL